MAQEIADSKLIDTWASSGLIVEPDASKIIEGWQLGEQPPHEYMNWLQNTFGSKLNHILKNGVASWNNKTQYLAGSSVQHSGNVWLCKATNTNSAPTDVNTNWKRIITVEALDGLLNGYVALTGNQTIAGVKTFSSTIVGSINGNAATVTNGVYTTGNQTIAGVKTFSSSPIVPTPTTGTQAVNKDYVDSFPILPIGAILNGYTIFNNCIVAFGGVFNRADYPKLWAYLEANPSLVKTQAQWTTENTTNGMCGFYSDGNGTTTFRVPNLDKAFLRPDNRGVGSFQDDAIRNITGTAYLDSWGFVRAGSVSGAFSVGTRNLASFGSGTGSAKDLTFDASLVVPTANENRPKNIAVFPLIVAK